MPTFPNISTLTSKTSLTGDEVIQISATETTTLKAIVEQLGFSKVAPMGAFEDLPEGGNFVSPNPEDNLVEVLNKIISRAGSNQFYIAPVYSLDRDGNRVLGETTLLLLTRSSEPQVNSSSLHSIKLSSQGFIEVKGADAVPDSKFNPNNESAFHTLSDMVDYLDNYESLSHAYFHYKINGDSLKEYSGTSISSPILPGDIIYHSGDSFSSYIPIDYAGWIGGYSNYQAMIVSKVNITTARFLKASNKYKYLFMRGFDVDPGTEWKCITLQRIALIDRPGLTNLPVILVNKCGYSEDGLSE